jgi:hypothetical protein
MRRVMRVRSVVFLLLCAYGGVGQTPRNPAPESRPSNATDAVAELRSLVDAKKFAEAWERAAHARALARGETGTDALREETRKLTLKAGLPIVGAAAGFLGTTTAKKDGAIEIVYDLATTEWESDFLLEDVLPTTEFSTREGRVVRRTGAVLFRGVFKDDVRIDVEGVARANRDFGPVFFDPDEPGDARFLVGFHRNAYFATKYDETRSVTPGHVLLMAGRGAESRAKSRPTQLLARSTTPDVELGSVVRCSLTLRGSTIEFQTGADPKTACKAAFQLKTPSQAFPRVRPGFLLRSSEFEFVRITMTGKLDAAYEREERDALKATL